jgi:hypothetical protein
MAFNVIKMALAGVIKSLCYGHSIQQGFFNPLYCDFIYIYEFHSKH